MKIIVLFFFYFLLNSLFAQNDNWQLFTNTEIGIESSSITCIVEDKEYSIWIGTNGEGIFKYDWNNWIKFNTDNSPLPSNDVTSLAVDSNNCIWIGTYGNIGGLTKFDGYSWIIYNVDSNTTYDIQIDSNGSFWMGSYWKGLIEFDGDTTFTYYNSNNTNLSHLRDEIISVNTQLDSVILCGTELGGAAKFNKATATWAEYFAPVVPIDLVINSIIVDKKKNIWFAGIQYVSMMDSNLNWSVFDYNVSNNHDFYHDIVLLVNNNILFSSSNGLLELNYSNSEVWKNVKPPLSELDSVGCHGLAKDHLGNIWIGFYNGYLAIYNPNGITDINTTKDYTPVNYSLSQNYPNPFNPTTVINYQLKKTGFVSIKVFDVLGKEVKTLVDEIKPTGSYKIKFDASSLPSGIYFYRLKSSSFSETKKLMLLR